MQRGARCIATSTPLEDNGGLIATPGGPPWSAADKKREDGGGRLSGFQLRRSPELKFSSVKFRDIIVTRTTLPSQSEGA